MWETMVVPQVLGVVEHALPVRTGPSRWIAVRWVALQNETKEVGAPDVDDFVDSTEDFSHIGR
jgi:hypothetical protein